MRSGALPVVWRTLGVAMLLTAPLGVPAVLEAQWTTRSLLSMLALGAFGTGDRQRHHDRGDRPARGRRAPRRRCS